MGSRYEKKKKKKKKKRAAYLVSIPARVKLTSADVNAGGKCGWERQAIAVAHLVVGTLLRVTSGTMSPNAPP